MSLSDCPECYDTPCSCGAAGYVTVYAKDAQREKLKALSGAALHKVQARLEQVLDGLLSPGASSVRDQHDLLVDALMSAAKAQVEAFDRARAAEENPAVSPITVENLRREGAETIAMTNDVARAITACDATGRAAVPLPFVEARVSRVRVIEGAAFLHADFYKRGEVTDHDRERVATILDDPAGYRRRPGGDGQHWVERVLRAFGMIG